MKLFMLFTSLFAIAIFVYFVLRGYQPVPTDYLVLGVFNLLMADGYRKNKN